MSKPKLGLGRGLDALIAPGFNPNAQHENITLPAGDIKPDNGHQNGIIARIQVSGITANPFQPRTEFDPEALDELKKSILANGLIQPITVRRSLRGEGYELISGERRLRAFREIGYKEIPAYIIKVDSDEAMLALALIENIQRERLNAIEVAKAYKRLIDECSLSQEEIAESVGKDRTTITNSLRLLKLPAIIQENIISEQLSPGHARALINIPDEKTQIELMHKIIAENLSVRKVETLVKKLLEGQGEAKDTKVPEVNRLQLLSQRDVEEKLRRVFGTKVLCKQKQNGTGEIVIEFYSNDELERLFEMFEVIGKDYN
ncbi:MAG: ParB/RepB/Spo0J family partition protein [Bacteroidota bacterium]